MTIPTFDLSRAPVGELTLPHLTGGGLSGGRALSGIDTVVDMYGGPLVAMEFANIQLGNASPVNMRYMSLLGAILNRRTRSMLVPAPIGWIQPVAAPTFVNQGALNGTLLLRPKPVDKADTLAVDAQVNAGQVTVNLGSRTLYGGEWFELVHATMLNRIYCVVSVDGTVTNADGTTLSTVSIMPPLRDGSLTGDPVNWDNPKCLMTLAEGTEVTVKAKQTWWATPTISFIESWALQ